MFFFSYGGLIWRSHVKTKADAQYFQTSLSFLYFENHDPNFSLSFTKLYPPYMPKRDFYCIQSNNLLICLDTENHKRAQQILLFSYLVEVQRSEAVPISWIPVFRCLSRLHTNKGQYIRDTVHHRNYHRPYNVARKFPEADFQPDQEHVFYDVGTRLYLLKNKAFANE